MSDISEVEFDWRLNDGDLAGCDIIYHNYDRSDWQGRAFTLYRKDDVLYEVNGSHCSCYNLEGQWDPEKTSYDAILFRINKGDFRGVDKEDLKRALGEYP